MPDPACHVWPFRGIRTDPDLMLLIKQGSISCGRICSQSASWVSPWVSCSAPRIPARGVMTLSHSLFRGLIRHPDFVGGWRRWPD